MGCCASSSFKEANFGFKNQQGQNHHHPHSSNGTDAIAAGLGGVSGLMEFSLTDLKAVTNNFNSEFIISESSEKARNVVYKGQFWRFFWFSLKPWLLSGIWKPKCRIWNDAKSVTQQVRTMRTQPGRRWGPMSITLWIFWARLLRILSLWALMVT